MATNLGIWIWGFVTAALGVAVVFVIASGRPTDVYTRVKDSATAIGAVVAASALAWSLFFQAADSQRERDKIMTRLETDMKQLNEKLSDSQRERDKFIDEIRNDIRQLNKALSK